MEIVVNRCYGGYGLSQAAYEMIARELGRECHWFVLGYEFAGEPALIPFRPADHAHRLKVAFDKSTFGQDYSAAKKGRNDSTTSNGLWSAHEIPDYRYERSNSLLVKVVKALGEEANGEYAKLDIVDIPDGVEYEIDDYDGVETIHERHRSW